MKPPTFNSSRILLLLLLLQLLLNTPAFAAATSGAAAPGNASSSSSVSSSSWILHNLETSVHPLWLRERCHEAFYADPETKQPRYNLHEEVTDLKVTKVTYHDHNATVQVTFSDDQTCALSTDMLQAELTHSQFFLQAPQWELPNLHYWDASLIAPPVFAHDEIINVTHNSRHTLQFLSTLLSTGIALVENVPIVPGQCSRFGQQFSTLRDTEWGIFNVKSVPDENGGVQRKDLAYTPRAIGMHIDNAYRVDTPPAFQLLHAMEHCDGRVDPVNCQVHNKFVDGFAVARALCRENREFFDILTTTVLRWENNGGDDSSLLFRYAPMIELAPKPTQNSDKDGCPEVEGISFSAKSGGYAPHLDKNTLDLFYRAKRRFSAMLHSSEFTIQSQFYPGALVIFNNRRILHSRSAIAIEDGPRWLQGCYINRDGLLYLHERLRRQLSPQIPPWRNLREATSTHFDAMGLEYDLHVSQKTMSNLLDMLQAQKEAYLGAPVSLYEHNLQTASRALRDGQDDETVVVSLFHDLFETLAVKNHGELAASMLAPWVSPRSQWLLAHHEIFQGFYYFDYYGLDKNARDMFVDSPYYDWTVEWCEKYDQASFDKDYPTLPLEAFLPAVRRVLAKPSYWWNPSHPKAGAVSAKPNGVVDDPASPLTVDLPDANMAGMAKVTSGCQDTWTCYG